MMNTKRIESILSSRVEKNWFDQNALRGSAYLKQDLGDAITRGFVAGTALIPTAVLSTVESISDFVAGTSLQIAGEKDAAKDLYSNSWSGKIKQKVRDYVNPAGHKTLNTIMDVGDVVADAAVLVGLTLATGGLAGAAAGAAGATGAAATASVKVASLMPIFLSAAGSGTAEAVQTTGKLGAKENIYGVTTGAVELATEYALGAGGKILRGVGFLGEAGEEATKGIARHAVLKGILTNAGGEFMEESMSYGASVVLKNMTGVDPNAKFDMSEMFQQGLMGAVAGGVLGFGSSAISVGNATSAGKRIVEKGEGAINEALAEASALVSEAAKTSEGTFTNMVAVERVSKALSLYQEDAKSGKLTKSRQAYYLGQISQGLYEVEMYDSAAQYGKDIANTVAKGGEDAQRLIDGANAMFEENLGRKLTKEDFASVDSIGTKMLSAVSVYKNLTTPTDAELVDVNIRNESAVAYSPEKMATDIAALNEGEGTALYNLGNGKMAVVTKRAGDGSISVGLIENRDSTKVKAQHGIKSIEGAIEAVNAMQNGTFGQPKASAPKKAESVLKEKFELTEKNVQNANVKQFEKAPEVAKKPAKPKSAKAPEAAKKAEPKKADKVEKAEVKTEKKEAPKKEAEDISKVEDRLRFKKYDGMTFTASEISSARADFKHFDALPASVRSDILIMRKSAAEAKIPDASVKGLTRLMAAYHFKAVFSSEITSNGFWVHGKELAVINPNDIYQTTFGHELSHRVEDYKNYGAFAKAVEALAGKKQIEAEVKKYLTDYNAVAEQNGWAKLDATKDADMLHKEAVANLVGKYLSNAQYIEKLANADRNFMYRAYRAIKGMRADIAAAQQISAETERSTFTEYRTLRRMERLFETALALDTKSGDKIISSERDGQVTYNIASYKEKSIKVNVDGKEVILSGREILENALRKNPEFSQADIDRTLNEIDSISKDLEELGTAFNNFREWSNAQIEYNPETNELVISSLVNNGEYELNVDFSTICKKRVAFTQVLNAIVRSGKEIDLTPTKIATINTILAEHGFETACKMCFVEAKRNNLQAWAKNFVNGKKGKSPQKGWNALVKAINPNAPAFSLESEKTMSDEDVLDLDRSLRSDLAADTTALDEVIAARQKVSEKDNTESKIAKLLKEHPEYAFTLEPKDLFGSEGVTKLKKDYPEVYSVLLQSYGVATPKITLPAAPYASELVLSDKVKDKKTQTIGDYSMSIGGVRVQSFSDYMVLRFFDYVQMLADASAQGMAMQSYTKEISYVALFGKTGMKINASIVPGVDAATVKKYGKDYAGLVESEDGTFDYVFAKESIQLEDKVVDGRTVKGVYSLMKEDGYRGNVGTILIGVSRQQILKALADPNISMVIPFHKSGLSKLMASIYGISEFNDYTSVQKTRKPDGTKPKEFDYYASYRKNKGDSKKVAKEYLAYCDEMGYIPKFEEFRANPNYYKLLIDFTSDYVNENGKRVVVQQKPVSLNLPEGWLDIVKHDLKTEQSVSDRLDAEMDGIIEEALSTNLTNKEAAERQAKVSERDDALQVSHSVSSQPTMIKFNAPSGNLGIVDRLKRIGGNVKSAITEADSRKAALEVMREAFDTFSVHWSNSFAAVETQLRRMVSNGTWDGSYGRITRQSAQEKVQSVRLSEAKALGMLTVGQYKVDGTKYENGEPLFKILEPILAKKGETITVEGDDGNLVTMKANGSELAGELYQEFCDYAAHVTALERSAIGKDPWSHLSDADKQAKIAEYERKHPEFKDILEKFAQFNRNVLQYRVDAGTLSQESMDAMIAQYPHYIPMIKPTIEQMNTTGAVKGKSSIAVTNNIKKAKGGDHIVNDPIAAYCDQVIGAIKAANTNILMQELYDTADGKHIISDKMLEDLGEQMETVSKDFISNPDENADAMSILESLQKKATDGATNAVYFYKNGKIHSMKVSKDIFLGLQSINKSDYTFRGGWMVKGMAAVNSGYKRLVTSMNPFFSPKNMIRDLWDGLMHSRFSVKKFTVEYAKLGSMMAGGKITEHPMWDEFISNGGLQASYFDRSEGKLHRRSKRTGLEVSDAGVVGKTMQTIENFNVLIEALPRFTEYVLTRNNGGSVAEALNNSAEVTTNFARSGVWGGFLNKTIMPFLNPSIQGFSKPIRNIIEHGSYKGMISLLGRAALLGVVPIILNNLLYEDDEDYEVLDDSTKENNFVFKVGDYFVKIPRGRVVSVVSGLYNRTTKQMTGRYVDWKDYLENVKSQATPLDSITRTIFSPFKDVSTNTTWYGGVIENDAMQNLAPEDRYDEYTSSLAIAIGKVTGKTIDVSPKKIHYLLDQYSGIIGDLVLPITSTASKSNPLVSNFAVDVNSNTNLSDRFYKIYNESLYQKNRGDENAYYLNKRLGETKQQVSDLYKQIKEINQSDLSKAEKRSQVSILRATINQLYKTAIADASTYSKAVEAASVVESYYKVVKVTSGNAKKLGAEKESVGKYAVVYNDQTVRFCDTESEANEYKSSVARKTTYAEANRLAYGAQYALTQYNTALGEKASTLNRLGIDSERFYDFYMTSRYYSGSDKKSKIEKYCKEGGLSKNETAILMYFSGYTSYRDKVVSIAKKSGFTKAEIEAL